MNLVDDDIDYCYECWHGECQAHQVSPERFEDLFEIYEEIRFARHMPAADFEYDVYDYYEATANVSRHQSALESALLTWIHSGGPMLVLIEAAESRYDKLDSKGHA